MSVAAGAAGGMFSGWDSTNGFDQPQEQYDDGSQAMEQIRGWISDAVTAIADKATQVDGAASGVPNGVLTQLDIQCALANGVFDSDPRRSSIQRFLADQSAVRLVLGTAAFDESGSLELSIDQLDQLLRDFISQSSGAPTASTNRSGFEDAQALNASQSGNRKAAVDPAPSSVESSVAAHSLWDRLPSSWSPADFLSLDPATSSANPVVPQSASGSTNANQTPASTNGAAAGAVTGAVAGAASAGQSGETVAGGGVAANPQAANPQAANPQAANPQAANPAGSKQQPGNVSQGASTTGNPATAGATSNPAAGAGSSQPAAPEVEAAASATAGASAEADSEPDATASLSPLQAARQTLVADFGFLDGAGFTPEDDRGQLPEDRVPAAQQASAVRDGKVSLSDLTAASNSEMLIQADRDTLKAIVSDTSLFNQLDARDGAQDGSLSYGALWRAASADEQDLTEGASSSEIPDVRQARYSEKFFELQPKLVGGSWEAASVGGIAADPVAAVLGRDTAGFNAFDALDGSADSTVDGNAVQLTGGDAKENIFSAPANDGSGMSVLSAAIKAMSDEFANLPKPELPEALSGDRARAYRLALALSDNLSAIGTQPSAPGQDRSISRDDIGAAISAGSLSAADSASLSELVSDADAWNWLSGAGGQAAGDSIGVVGLQSVVTAFNKANFSGIIMAAGAVKNGIPMKTSEFSGRTFPNDMSADFCAGEVFDPAIAEVAYARLMNDPEIQAVLGEKVRNFMDNAPSRAQSIFQEITSPYYYDAVSYLEKQPTGDVAAQQKVAADLAALSTLDTNLAEQASIVLLQRKLAAEVSSSRPSNVPAEHMLLATRDFLTALSLDLRSARGLFRLPGLLAGHDAGWQKIGSILKFWTADKLNGLSSALSDAIVSADKAGGAPGAPPPAQAVIDAAQKNVDETTKLLQKAPTEVERTRLQGVLDGFVKRAKDVKDFASACEKIGVWASLAGGISIASGVYKIVKGGENLKDDPWGRLSIANDFVLATCFTPGYINSANFVMSKLGHSWSLSNIGMAPSQTFSNLVRAFITGDTTVVGTSLSGATIGMALKGLTGVSLVAAGTIGGAMGIKQLIDGVHSDDKYEISAGSLNLAMGVSWAASGATYLMASALTGPLIGIGCLFGVAAVFLSMFGPKADDNFADSFQKRVGDFSDSGVLRDGWSDALKGWFNESSVSESDTGLELGL